MENQLSDNPQIVRNRFAVSSRRFEPNSSNRMSGRNRLLAIVACALIGWAIGFAVVWITVRLVFAIVWSAKYLVLSIVGF